MATPTDQARSRERERMVHRGSNGVGLYEWFHDLKVQRQNPQHAFSLHLGEPAPPGPFPCRVGKDWGKIFGA